MPAPPLSAVGALARDGDEPRFLAALFAPEEKREPLFALIAFNLELAKIPATVSEPMLGAIRLQWWRDALEDLFVNGRAAGHEVTQALGASRKALDAASLFEMIDARELALEPGGLEADALARFIAGTGGALTRAQALALGAGADGGAVAGLVGWAEGAGRLIAALPAMLGEGGGPLADAPELERLREGASAAALRGRLASLADEGLAKLREARSRRAALPKAARGPLLSAHVFEPALRAARAPGYDPFSPALRSPFGLRAGLLVRGVSGRF